MEENAVLCGSHGAVSIQVILSNESSCVPIFFRDSPANWIVLPTSGGARMYSGLSTESFIKKPTIQELNEEGLINIKDMVINLAEAEGLCAHAFSVKKRLEDI